MSKVSVIIPTYNCAKYVAETINSVLNQTYQDFEIIVVDSSTDNTKKIVYSYINELANTERHSCIKYFYQSLKGVAAARNFGIQKSSGDYIAFLDGDDVWLEDKLMMQISIMKSEKEVAMVFTDGESFNQSGIIRHSLVRPKTQQAFDGFRGRLMQTSLNDGAIFKGRFFDDFLFENCIPTSSVLVRKNCLSKIGYFKEELPLSEDYDLWIRIAQKYTVLFINRITERYRVRDEGLSGNISTRPYLWQKWIARMFEIYLRTCPSNYKHLIKNKVIESYKNAIWGYLALNELQEVRKLCFRTLFYTKTQIKLYLYILASFLPIKVVAFIKKVKFSLCHKSV